jgi:hypothetical protein
MFKFIVVGVFFWGGVKTGQGWLLSLTLALGVYELIAICMGGLLILAGGVVMGAKKLWDSL